MAGKRINELTATTSLNMGDALHVLNNGVSRQTLLQTLMRLFLGTLTAGTYQSAKIVVSSDGAITSITNGRLSATATLDFASIAAGAEASLTVTVTGAATGDPVSLGLPAAFTAGISVAGAWVSSANTVTIKLRNTTVGAIDPASGSYTVIVHKL